MDHTHNDCLVIVVMTHGDSGTLYAKDDDYQLSELWKPFVGDKCPTLIGKPKLMFLQACRGAKLDPGMSVRCFAFGKDAVDGQPVVCPMSISIPTMADLLVMYATFEGKFLTLEKDLEVLTLVFFPQTITHGVTKQKVAGSSSHCARSLKKTRINH
jgi:Caspase domain